VYPVIKTTSERVFDQIKAKRDFDKHQITRENHGQWYCSVPGQGGIESFRVVMVPYSIIVTGDLGEIILSVNHNKPLRWALGANFRPDNLYYPFTKLAQLCRQETFKPKQATAWLFDEIKEARKEGYSKKTIKKRIKMAREWKDTCPDEDHYSEQAWYDLCHEFDIDDPPGFREYSWRTHYVMQALCWFMQHVGASDPRFAEELEHEESSY
jgi:hypothetical protein